MVLLLSLLGCGSGFSNPAGLTEDGVVDPNAPPELSIETPAPNAYLGHGTVEVTGRAIHVDELTVNGVPTTVTGGTFAATVPLTPGLNVVDVQGTGPDGEPFRAIRSALSGDYAAPAGFVNSGIQLHIGPNEMDGLGPMVSGLLDPAALTAQVTQMNPIIDDGTIRADIVAVNFGTPVVSATPTNGMLDVSIALPDFEIPVEAEADIVWGIGIDVSGELTVDELILDTRIALGTDGQGGLTVELLDTNIDFVNFAIDIDGIADFLEDLVLDDSDIEAMITGEIDTLVAELPAIIDDALAGLDLSMETELMGQPLVLETGFSAAGVTPQGVYLGVDTQIDVVGANAEGPGHLALGTPPRVEGSDVTLQIADDFMNRFLHELWASGALEISLPVEAGSAESFLLGVFGGEDGAGGALTLATTLPPTWVGRGGESRLQLGGVELTVETPGGDFGDVVTFDMALDARAGLNLDGEAAGIVLSDAVVTLNPTGASAGYPDLREKVPELETTVGLGMGIINSQLSFPLDGTGLSLPALDVLRDPADMGLMVQLSLADVDLGGLIGGDPGTGTGGTPGGTGGTGSTTPPQPGGTPAPFTVAIPQYTPVYDYDTTMQWDDAVGWICNNDRVDVNANTGFWYVDDGGEVRIQSGTGHTIYAVDDAEVVLQDSGNTVYADVGATVDDQVGGNTIILADPLTFDTSNAPSDGC